MYFHCTLSVIDFPSLLVAFWQKEGFYLPCSCFKSFNIFMPGLRLQRESIFLQFWIKFTVCSYYEIILWILSILISFIGNWISVISPNWKVLVIYNVFFTSPAIQLQSFGSESALSPSSSCHTYDLRRKSVPAYPTEALEPDLPSSSLPPTKRTKRTKSFCAIHRKGSVFLSAIFMLFSLTNS